MLTNTALQAAKPKDKSYKVNDEKGLYSLVNPGELVCLTSFEMKPTSTILRMARQHCSAKKAGLDNQQKDFIVQLCRIAIECDCHIHIIHHSRKGDET